MPRLTIDGIEVEVPKGTTVIEAAELAGIRIPRYCYHPGLTVAGNCRICLVEIEKSPKLQIACNTPAGDGMVVRTRSEKAEEGRRAVLEYMLANHPLDCPVCDQSGECDLQNFYMQFGRYASRFREAKFKKKKAVPIGPHVMLDSERCILCSRCVRFTSEVTKTSEFGIFNRSHRAEIGLYPGAVLDNPYSANVVDICPVGALTERDFRFKARVWYLSSAKSVCAGCSRGCSIDVHYVLDRPHLNDGARILRVKPRPNPDVNRWWMCDAGRYGFKPVDEGRLSELRGAPSWEAAADSLAKVLEPLRAEGGASKLGVILSSRLTTEELFLVRELFSRGLGARVSSPVRHEGGSDDLLIQADKTPNSEAVRLLGMDKGPSPEELVSAAKKGELSTLWVFGEDLSGLAGGEKGLTELAGKLENLVYQGPNEDPTAAAANWVLPAAAYVEKDGTFINCGGRIQRIGRVFPPKEGSREDWRMLAELGGRLGLKGSPGSPEDVFKALAAQMPFSGLDYDKIGDAGLPLGAAKEAAR